MSVSSLFFPIFLVYLLLIFSFFFLTTNIIIIIKKKKKKGRGILLWVMGAPAQVLGMSQAASKSRQYRTVTVQKWFLIYGDSESFYFARSYFAYSGIVKNLDLWVGLCVYARFGLISPVLKLCCSCYSDSCIWGSPRLLRFFDMWKSIWDISTCTFLVV